METCSTCQFYYPLSGECHRFPPTVIQGSQLFPSWSLVRAEDWCGEWKGETISGGLTLTSLTPNTLPAGSTPSTVDVAGTGFDTTCTVNADGVPRVTFFIDIGHLQYTARPDQATSGDSYQITVSNATDTSNALPFTFT